jgi:hypothetical protein
MGLLQRHEAKKAERAEHAAALKASQALAAWQQADAGIRELLDEARTDHGAVDGGPLVLKTDERAFQVVEGAALIEPRRLPGHWEGRSQGVSFRVAKGVRYRVGANKGHYVQGDEVPTPIDTGTVTITNQRVVFQGAKATREWAFSKLLGVQHIDQGRTPWTALQVSNRQKTSGFLYTTETARGIRFRLDLAIAHYHGQIDELISDLEDQLAEHAKTKPPEPGPTEVSISRKHVGDSHDASWSPRPPASAPPPGWLQDPSSRHQFRYWDGQGWTDDVADNGESSKDPLA